jgi:hypothetical protein
MRLPDSAKAGEPSAGELDAAGAHRAAEPTVRSVVQPAPVRPRPGGRGAPASAAAGPGLRWRLPLLTYAACQVIFLFWWAGFYPGLMNRDSITYVLHVTTGPWVNDHSVLYDSLVWLSLHTTGDLGALTLAQTVAMSAALAYTVAAFRRLGVPGRWTAIAAVVVAALPPLGSFVIFIWKDVPFSICAYLVVPTVAHLLSLRTGSRWPAHVRGDAAPSGETPPDPRSSRDRRRLTWLIAALGFELLGMCLFRNNGFAPVVVAAAVLIAVLPGIRSLLAATAAAVLCATFALNFFVYPAAGIRPMPSSLTLGPVYADIAVAYAGAPSTFTAADRSVMQRVEPLADWAKNANCYDSDLTTHPDGFVHRATLESTQLTSLWLRVLKRSPQLIASARICRGSIAWLVFPGSHSAQAFLYSSRIPADLYGAISMPDVRDNRYRADLATRPLSAAAGGVTSFLRKASEVPQLEWLLWRGATWCYVAYLIVWAVARRRRDWALLALVAVVVGQQVTVFADIPTQAFRYMVSPVYIGIMLLPLFFARGRMMPLERDPPTAAAAGAAP